MTDINAPQNSPPFVGTEFPDKEFSEIRDLLLTRRGLDLDMYKDRCLKRRIATRVRACGFHAAAPYVERLRQQEEELDALLATLTIHVSQFFRNPSTFAALESQVLPELIGQARRSNDRKLKIWSVGCAGGEEPFSLALLLDNLDTRGVHWSILGSDVSREVLQRAEEGLFDPQRLTEVPAEVLQRHFSEEQGQYRLERRLLRTVEFRHHNILSDEPYPAADLILCRNVLIYFSREEQEKVFRRFAEALSPGGFLVLGKAETLQGSPRRLFTVESPSERIYRRTRCPEQRFASAGRHGTP